MVTIAERPELLEAAYPLARDEGYPDLALEGSISIPLDEWLRDEATLPEGSFVALADGEIVGYSGLMAHDNDGVAEDGLTVVRRDWRRRGLAKALKQRELAWAAAAGFARSSPGRSAATRACAPSTSGSATSTATSRSRCRPRSRWKMRRAVTGYSAVGMRQRSLGRVRRPGLFAFWDGRAGKAGTTSTVGAAESAP